MRQRADLIDRVRVGRIDRVDGAQGAGQRQLVVGQVDGDHGRGPAGERTEHAGQTHTAQTNNDDALARADLGRVHHSAHAGQDGAAEQGGFLETQGRVDLHQRPAGHHSPLGEGGAAEVVIQGFTLAEHTAAAGQEFALAVRRRAGFAQRRTAFGAGGTVTAGRHEDHDNGVADRKIGHALSECLNDPRRLVAQGHGQGAGPVAVDHAEVGVTKTCSLDGDPHLTRAGRIQRDGLEAKRAAVCIGPSGPGLAQDGGTSGDG